MSQPHPDVDTFLRDAKAWRGEIAKLRGVLLASKLDEAFKWRKPCYSIDGTNVAILQPFKSHCALMFFQGALLEDTHGLLRSQGPNSQAARRLEFRSEAEVKKTVVRAYVEQAIALAKSGAKVDLRAKDELELPPELAEALAKDRKLAKAFAALTPGRRRGYALHVGGAKKSETRRARVERCAPSILAGVGFDGR